MISVHQPPPANGSNRNSEKRKREMLLYKIGGLCYMITVIVLATFFIIRAFKYKYLQEDECYSNGWIDTVITVLTLSIVFLASALLITSLKYVFKCEDEPPEPLPVVDKTEDFIRRNSQPLGDNVIARTSVSGGKWLNSVKNEAYERRQSMVPGTVPKTQSRLNP